MLHGLGIVETAGTFRNGNMLNTLFSQPSYTAFTTSGCVVAGKSGDFAMTRLGLMTIFISGRKSAAMFKASILLQMAG
jgi:hypothetical protein